MAKMTDIPKELYVMMNKDQDLYYTTDKPEAEEKCFRLNYAM